MINYLRVMLFFCGFVIGAYQKENQNSQPLIYLQSPTLQDPEKISKDTLTWEDRNY